MDAVDASPDDTQALEQLLAATAAGDGRAFAELYARTSPRLFAILLRMLKRRDWAEEALQDCYVRIWKRSESYDAERGAPLAWLATIARYRALDLLRAHRPEGENVEPGADAADVADDAARPDDRAAEQEGLARLQDCLGRLPDDQRRSVLLAYYEGYTHGELSSRLNAPLGTVKSWVRRGLQQLRTCLEVA